MNETTVSAAPRPWPYPLWIAHRGAGKLAPENTLAAFRLGAVYGYRAFECDVKLSADGVPFLLHDDTLARTTSGNGSAGEKSWAQLSRLDAGAWHSRLYAGEPLATLEAVARFCRSNGFTLNIEIKPSPGREAETGGVVAQAVARLWSGDDAPPLLSSFSPVALQAAFDAAPELPRALLLDSLRPGWFDEAQALRCRAVVTAYALIDPLLVTQLHAVGVRALAYTVNDPAEVRRLCACAIDGLITDAVDRFAPAAGGLVELRP